MVRVGWMVGALRGGSNEWPEGVIELGGCGERQWGRRDAGVRVRHSQIGLQPQWASGRQGAKALEGGGCRP